MMQCTIVPVQRIKTDVLRQEFLVEVTLILNPEVGLYVLYK